MAAFQPHCRHGPGWRSCRYAYEHVVWTYSTCATSLMVELRLLALDDNKLRGSIPQALYCHQHMVSLSMCSNELSGTIAMIISPLDALVLCENKLTGSFPAFLDHSDLTTLTLSANMLEGTLHGKVLSAPDLVILDISGQAGQIKGLRGELPPKLSQASSLRHLMVARHILEGCVPHLQATFSTLALHGNRFSLFQSAHWQSHSVILMHINLLSCPPSACGDIGTDLSRQTLANCEVRIPVFMRLAHCAKELGS